MVTAVYFETGDFVEEGQVLATLDSDSLNTAAINIETAQLQLETAQKELERTQVLYENDGATQQTLETAENAVQSAQLQLESAQDNYNTLQKNISVTAPISGVIESRDVDVYDNASAQQAICVISQKQSMQVVFQVPERVKNILSMGTTVTVDEVICFVERIQLFVDIGVFQALLSVADALLFDIFIINAAVRSEIFVPFIREESI